MDGDQHMMRIKRPIGPAFSTHFFTAALEPATKVRGASDEPRNQHTIHACFHTGRVQP